MLTGLSRVTAGYSNVTPAHSSAAPEKHQFVHAGEQSAERLKRLLHVGRAKVQSPINGSYRGLPVDVTQELLVEHLAGTVSLAFECLNDLGRACFAGADIDAGFQSVAPSLVDSVRGLLGDVAAKGILLTEGSSQGRGKAIFILRSPMNAEAVRKFLALCLNPVVSEHNPRHVSVGRYPQTGAGGQLRVLGKNADPSRHGSIEAIVSHGGSATSLDDVRPLDPMLICHVVRQHWASAAKPRTTIATLIQSEWTWDKLGSTRVLFRNLQRIAGEVQRIRGAGDIGRHAYCQILGGIADRSPDLDRPSPTTRDDRNPIRRELKELRAWHAPLGLRNSFVPLNVRGMGLPERVCNLYEGVSGYVAEYGLSPSCFAIDLARVCDVVGLPDKTTSSRTIAAAAKHDVLVIHDRGRKRERGERGLQGMYGLVGVGDTPETVRDRVARTDGLRRRLEARRDLTGDAACSPSPRQSNPQRTVRLNG